MCEEMEINDSTFEEAERISLGTFFNFYWFLGDFTLTFQATFLSERVKS